MNKWSIPLVLMLVVQLSCGFAQQPGSDTSAKKDTTMTEKVELSESEWKSRLTPAQYHILREKGTERPFTGEFNKHSEPGTYVCAGCGYELFTSDMKFDSHCGWPSFDKEIGEGRVKKVKDFTHGMIRTEILCARCGGHLGHIFDDGPTETGMRYCVNSLSLGFKKK
jgi:methionine-R-sulfoxide reductase